MENTLENKQKFFAQYWGQKVFINAMLSAQPADNVYIEHLADVNEDYSAKDEYLELKPLSAISDEDAIEIANICNHPSGVTWNIKEQGYFAIYNKYNDHADQKETLRIYYRNSFEIFSLDEYGRVFDYDLERLLNICDYLRSKGYLLPFMDLSIEQILEYKWAVIK